jgi:hypothetical protein
MLYEPIWLVWTVFRLRLQLLNAPLSALLTPLVPSSALLASLLTAISLSFSVAGAFIAGMVTGQVAPRRGHWGASLIILFLLFRLVPELVKISQDFGHPRLFWCPLALVLSIMIAMPLALHIGVQVSRRRLHMGN